MSDFHGGFLVRSIDAAVGERIRLALAAALRERRIDLERNSLTFAVTRGCPVMHVAVRGPVADGKDYAFFHHESSDLGAAVARAAGADVWAYHYENQSGSESVRAFAGDGAERSNVYCSWDDLEADGEDGERDSPLGALARELGVDRGVLEYDLGYGTETLRVGLTGAACTDAIAAYLAAPARAPELALRPEPRVGRATQGLYFPRWMADELEAHARRVDVPLGSIAWAVWEAAKPELFRTVPVVEGDTFPGEEPTGPARFMAPPPGDPPPDVVVPRLVPVFAKALAPAPSTNDKLLLKIVVPPRVLQELQDFAMGADHSLSWAMQQAYVLVRSRMHHATRPDA